MGAITPIKIARKPSQETVAFRNLNRFIVFSLILNNRSGNSHNLIDINIADHMRDMVFLEVG
jgi:hypothetical protein